MMPKEIADDLVTQWVYDVAAGGLDEKAACRLLRDRISDTFEAYARLQAAVAPLAPADEKPAELYKPDPSYYWGSGRVA